MKTVTVLGTEYVSRETLREAMGVVDTTFRNAEANEGLPPVRFGKKIHYRTEEVRNWLLRREQVKRHRRNAVAIPNVVAA